MAVNLFGEDFPQLFGTLRASLFTLFTIMTLEGWVDGVVTPIMEKYPYAWLFFIPFIIGTTFTILNLFIGIIVNAMQSEHAKEEAAERAAERDIDARGDRAAARRDQGTARRGGGAAGGDRDDREDRVMQQYAGTADSPPRASTCERRGGVRGGGTSSRTECLTEPPTRLPGQEPGAISPPLASARGGG